MILFVFVIFKKLLQTSDLDCRFYLFLTVVIVLTVATWVNFAGLHEATKAVGELTALRSVAGGRDVLSDSRNPGAPRALPGAGDQLC